MRLDSLSLNGFRNYDDAQISFSPGVNLILGENAQGKTNLLEAVTCLSTGHSFRTRKEKEMIGFGKDFADIEGSFFSGGRDRTIRLTFFAGRKRKQLLIGGVKQKTETELSGLLTTVLFCPEDLMILRSGASGRRKLIDSALCQLRPKFAEAHHDYVRCHEQKSRILKDYHENPSLLDALPEFNEYMARAGAVIISYRARYLRELAAAAAEYHKEFSGDREQLTMEYRTVSTVTDPFADRQTIFCQLLAHQQTHYEAEKASGQCLSGPHRDDFETMLNGNPIRTFGSQGQTRTAAISLKMAERSIFLQDTGEEPVLLLDDVLSELDAGRKDYILNHIRTGQVFITSCEENALPDCGRIIGINAGSVIGG